MSPRVAVIDVGSNSIKALVARKQDGIFGIEAIYEESLEVRISRGIGGEPPMLMPDRIEAGVEAVPRLWKACQDHGPLKRSQIVATSAVRSAANGHLFTESVEAETGLAPVILTGAEEADGIANGVRTDPNIEDRLDDFTVFDLGGGSLELIRFEHHGVTDRTSLPLGSVRLTEQFISSPGEPIPNHEAEALSNYVREHIVATDFPIRAPLVGCSGGLAALRQILARDRDPESCDNHSRFSRARIQRLRETVLSQDLDQRIQLSGLPPHRADIFPAALLTFEVIMELGQADALTHSFHNLRYGLAWALLNELEQG
ncbi:MAG: Ppx/GppA phosphatase family protein [Puniceicoccaceae bacterium]